MVKRNILIAAVVIVFPTRLSANPVSPYQFPAIAEVRWIGSVNWFIELDNTMWASVKKTTTTDIVKLYIASSKKTYSTRISFDDAGLGVLTRSSITGIPESQQVMIMNRDTIFIPDPDAADPHYPNDGWICPINNPKSGTSLIGITGGVFLQSSRMSIGTKGIYTTIHHLHFVDQNGLPVPNINVYSKTIQSDGGIYPTYINYSLKGVSDMNGCMTLSAAIGGGWIAYVSDTALRDSYIIPGNNSLEYTKYDPAYPTWSCNYIDELFECNDTVRIVPNFQKVPIVDNEGAPYPVLRPKSGGVSGPDVAFSILVSASGDIHFIIATRFPVDRASIAVRSIDGRTAATIDIPSGASGTRTVLWKAHDASGKKIAPGNYICRVLFDGKAVASRTVSVF